MRKLVDGQSYSVIKHEDQLYVADAARALLLFVEALARTLAQKQGRGAPVMTAYLDDDARALSPVTT